MYVTKTGEKRKKMLMANYHATELIVSVCDCVRFVHMCSSGDVDVDSTTIHTHTHTHVHVEMIGVTVDRAPTSLYRFGASRRMRIHGSDTQPHTLMIIN